MFALELPAEEKRKDWAVYIHEFPTFGYHDAILRKFLSIYDRNKYNAFGL